MASVSIHRIERLNYGLAAVGSVLAMIITQSRAITLGFAVGAALTCLNFFVLRKLVVKWTTQAAQGTTGNAQLLMLPKMIGMMGAVAIAVLVLPIDVIAFAIGYSVFIVSIVVETIYSAIRGEGAGARAPEKNGHG